MQNDITSTIAALADAGVRFLVVGGVAVVLHGYLRLTADLDLVIALDDENVQRAVGVFAASGFTPRVPVALIDFADPAKRRAWREEKNMQVFSLWHRDRPGFEVDVFVEEPFDFEEVFGRAIVLDVPDSDVRVVSLDDLIAMKQAAGRSRDLEDVAALQALRDKKERS